MATVTILPGIEIIRAFRGVLDFYCFRGSYCVKSWPRKPAMPRSLPSQETATTFGQFSVQVAASAAPVRDSATAATQATDWTWKDLMYRAAYNKLHRW